MNLRSGQRQNREAFTLVELLVVIGIVAVLASIILPLFGRTKQQADVVTALSNMKQLGVAMFSYANDNNFLLPNRAPKNPDGTAADRWPATLQPYVQNLAVYVSPIPDVQGISYKPTHPNDVLSNSANNTSYIYNGMNDRGAMEDSSVAVRLNTIDEPTQTALLGIPLPRRGQFYMDFSESGGNNNDVLNKTAFPNGSVYMFCDGSSRLLVRTTDPAANLQRPPNSGVYTDWLWLTDKSRADIIQQPP